MAEPGKALRCGLDILEALQGADGPLAFGRLRARVDVSPASFTRFLKILVRRGWVDRGEDGRYVLGVRAVQVGLTAGSRMSLLSLAREILADLAAATAETAELVVFRGASFTFLDRRESAHAVVLRARPGTHFNITADTAIGCLALFHGFGAGPGTLPQQLRSGIAADGYAEMLQNHDDVYRLAAPLFDADDACLGCVTVAAPTFRMSRERLQRVRRAGVRAANELSARLGSTRTITVGKRKGGEA